MPAGGSGGSRQKEAISANVRMYAVGQRWSTYRLLIIEGFAAVTFLGLCAAAVMVAQALAGAQTKAELIVAIIGGKTAASTLGVTAGVFGLAWGHRERRLRKRVIEEKHGRIAELERMIDPNRTPAALSERGDTLPEHR